MDRWEDAFDRWTPRPDGGRDGDTEEDGADAEREALHRLARELAEKRRATGVSSDAELEELKRSLRERAEAVSTRERELAELQRRLERTARKRGRGAAAAIAAAEAEALAARERSSFERARELERASADIDARKARLAEQELELDALRAGARSRGGAVPPTDGDLATQWRALEVARVTLETERETLRARERTLRRREDEYDQPLPPEALTPPGFSDGLASFVGRRSRR